MHLAAEGLKIFCGTFVLSCVVVATLIIVLGPSKGHCTQLKAPIKLLINDDLLLDSKKPLTINDDTNENDVGNSSPHLTRKYQTERHRLSYETIHRILRDENEPIYRRDASDLRYFQKQSHRPQHEINRRSSIWAETRVGFANMSYSNFTEFSAKFQLKNFSGPLKNLTDLSLAGNALHSFTAKGLTGLLHIDLSKNKLRKIPLDENSTVKSMNLNYNFIKEFKYSGSRNKHLQELYLSCNKIVSIIGLDLSILVELETLDISFNAIESLETSFFPQRMKNLKYLNLAGNRLSTINRETFYNLLSLNTLLLSQNNITDIDYETFLALPNLQYLDLSYNQLKGESIRALQGIPDLVVLSIAYNPELGSSLQEFVASWSLKELDASGTGLCQIPAALAQSVRTLKLVDNWLQVINCGDLDSYPLLQYLDLSHSHINDIEDDALGRLEIIEKLFLDHNSLRKVPVSLPTSLQHLFLHDNQITDVQPQTFVNLLNLRTLDLSGNQLLYLPALSLPKLITLNVETSGVTGVNQALVHTSPRLRNLLLEDNPIKCIDLLGITEWVSSCRIANNDEIQQPERRTNIKSNFLRTHNYEERFTVVRENTENTTCRSGNRASILTPPPQCAVELETEQNMNNFSIDPLTEVQSSNYTNKGTEEVSTDVEILEKIQGFERESPLKALIDIFKNVKGINDAIQNTKTSECLQKIIQTTVKTSDLKPTSASTLALNDSNAISDIVSSEFPQTTTFDALTNTNDDTLSTSVSSNAENADLSESTSTSFVTIAINLPATSSTHANFPLDTYSLYNSSTRKIVEMASKQIRSQLNQNRSDTETVAVAAVLTQKKSDHTYVEGNSLLSQKGLETLSDNGSVSGSDFYKQDNLKIEHLIGVSGQRSSLLAENILAADQKLKDVFPSNNSQRDKIQHRNKFQSTNERQVEDRDLIGTPLLISKGHILQKEQQQHYLATSRETGKNLLAPRQKQIGMELNRTKFAQQGENDNFRTSSNNNGKLSNGYSSQWSSLGQKNHNGWSKRRTKLTRQEETIPKSASTTSKSFVMKDKEQELVSHRKRDSNLKTIRKYNSSEKFSLSSKDRDHTNVVTTLRQTKLPTVYSSDEEQHDITKGYKQFVNVLAATSEKFRTNFTSSILGEKETRGGFWANYKQASSKMSINDEINDEINEENSHKINNITASTHYPNFSTLNNLATASEKADELEGYDMILAESYSQSQPPEIKVGGLSAAGNSERWLGIRTTTNGHPGLVLTVSLMMATVFIIGLVQVYRWHKPIRRYDNRLHHLGHHPCGYNGEASFLTYHDNSHRNTFLEENSRHIYNTSRTKFLQPYNSPLYNLKVHELEKSMESTLTSDSMSIRSFNAIGASPNLNGSQTNALSFNELTRREEEYHSGYAHDPDLQKDAFYIEITENCRQKNDFVSMKLLSTTSPSQGALLPQAVDMQKNDFSKEVPRSAIEHNLVFSEGTSNEYSQRNHSTPQSQKVGLW